MNSRARWDAYQVWLALLAALILVGLAAAGVVFARGLVVTNLTDLVPWGLWITLDLSCIALSAGAFLFSAAVHILGLREYRPLARTAVFIGLIGYSMAVFTLLLDIGRPDRFWHALVFWNPHSVLWEVTMCVTLYLSVLALEVAPIVGEATWLRRRWPKLSRRLRAVHRYAPLLALVGLGLSLLHQSSLGATYGVLKARPIWFRPGLSILFIASAAAGGPALVVLASMLTAWLSPRVRVDDRLLERTAKSVGWVLVGYLYLRFWDVLAMSYTYLPGRSEGMALLVKGPLAFNFWFGEILLGALLPAVVLLREGLRRNRILRLAALANVVAGVVVYRWNMNLVGQMVVLTYLPHDVVPRYAHYVPSLLEVLSGAGIIAYGLLAFTLGVRYLGVVRYAAEPRTAEEGRRDWVTVGAD